MTAQLPTCLVLEITWTDGSIPRSETYGPWCIDPDETWMLDPASEVTREIHEFTQAWQEASGCEPQRIALVSVQEPGKALEALRALKEAR